METTEKARRWRAAIAVLGAAVLLMTFTPMIGVAGAVSDLCPDSGEGDPPWTKINSSSGAASGAWGSFEYSGSTLDHVINAGFEVEICLKASTETHFFTVTGSGAVSSGVHGISHMAWRVTDEPVFVEAVLSGQKYLDRDADGAFGFSDTAIGGWDILIYDYTGDTKGALLETIATDVNTGWSYDTGPVLEGTQIDLLICEEQPMGWSQIAPASPPLGTTSSDEGADGHCYVVHLNSMNDVDVSGMDFFNVADLTVVKTAATSLTRTWTWDIDKTADETSLLYQEGQAEGVDVGYDVTAWATSADTDHTVFGTITVTNPTDFDATIDGVTDEVEAGISAVVTCEDAAQAPVTFPHVLAAGAAITCDYSASDESLSDTGTNTATVQASNGFEDGSGTADWDFADATVTEVDECIDVTDTLYAASLTPTSICADDLVANPDTGRDEYTWSYDIPFEPSDFACGETVVNNVASFTTSDDDNDTTASGDDDHTVTVNVSCLAGCTLTQGYWKNHGDPTRKQFDDTWLALGDADGDGNAEGGGETFYTSGKTWLQVFQTPPAGNPYYTLAHQYMAAVLNQVAGADSTAAVDTALAAAEAWFGGHTPSYKPSKAEKTSLTAWAGTLGGYNEGLTGPGHCDEPLA